MKCRVGVCIPISPGNRFSPPPHSHFLFPPALWVFSDVFLLRAGGAEEITAAVLQTTKRSPPPPLCNQNKQKFSFNPALAKCHSALGKSSSVSASPDQNPLVPGKWEIKLGTCGKGGGISPLLPLQKLFRLSSVPLKENYCHFSVSGTQLCDK